MATGERQRIVGRYVLYGKIAQGGMATVHVGQLRGPVGFARTVAIKRLHSELASDPHFVSMFVDEGRIASRIRHRNVAPVLDVIVEADELFLVMDYIEGEALSKLLRALHKEGEPMDPAVAVSIAIDALHGLQAAHTAKDSKGEALGIVHRDVSPQNLLVGVDGTTRVVDFGVAKAKNRWQSTKHGNVKGKLAYMAPEQLRERPVDGRTDVYAAAVVLWEALVGRMAFQATDAGAVVTRIVEGNVTAPDELRPDLPPELCAIVMRGLALDPDERFESAQEMALALEQLDLQATASAVGGFVTTWAAGALAMRRTVVHVAEQMAEQDPISLPEAESSFPRLAVADDEGVDTGDDGQPTAPKEGSSDARRTDTDLPSSITTVRSAHHRVSAFLSSRKSEYVIFLGCVLLVVLVVALVVKRSLPEEPAQPVTGKVVTQALAWYRYGAVYGAEQRESLRDTIVDATAQLRVSLTTATSTNQRKASSRPPSHRKKGFGFSDLTRK